MSTPEQKSAIGRSKSTPLGVMLGLSPDPHDAVAASVLVMSNAAEAGGKKRHGINASDSFQTVQHKRHRKHRGFNRHFYFNDHGYNSGRVCRRLKRKAYYTGSRYWWKRYRRCMNRYYY